MPGGGSLDEYNRKDMRKTQGGERPNGKEERRPMGELRKLRKREGKRSVVRRARTRKK